MSFLSVTTPAGASPHPDAANDDADIFLDAMFSESARRSDRVTEHATALVDTRGAGHAYSDKEFCLGCSSICGVVVKRGSEPLASAGAGMGRDCRTHRTRLTPTEMVLTYRPSPT